MYIMQSKIAKKTPIRVWSMGTGVGEMVPIVADEMSRFSFMSLTADLMIDINSFAADKILS